MRSTGHRSCKSTIPFQNPGAILTRAHGRRFKMFKTPTSFTPRLIIEKVLRKEGDDCKGWAVTEVHERGDGVWAKVSRIPVTLPVNEC